MRKNINGNFNYPMQGLRAISIIWVVLSHMTSLMTSSNHDIYEYILKNATILFLFISGYFFAFSEFKKNFNYLNYLNKKIKNVISPYIFMLMGPVFLGIFIGHHQLYNLSASEYFLWSILVGGVQIGPLWFIPMILLVYLFSFLFIRIKPNITFGIILLIMIFFSIFSTRPHKSINPFLSFLHFLSFYLLGIYFFYFEKYFKKITLGTSVFIYILLFSMALLIYFNNHEVLNSSYIYQNWFDKIGNFNPNIFFKIVLLIFLLLLVYKFCHSENILLKYFSDNSFGIFFIHGYYIYIFARFILPEIEGWKYIFLFEMIFVIGGSLITIFVIKKIISSRSQYVIGC